MEESGLFGSELRRKQSSGLNGMERSEIKKVMKRREREEEVKGRKTNRASLFIFFFGGDVVHGN